MEYRPLGRTGLQLSRLGLGGAPFGGLYGAVGQGEADRIVRTALDLGINFIDVAPYYGVTKAETVLGQALRGIPRDRYLLSTKVGRYDVAQFDFSAARVTASIDESLQRLGVDHVDLLIAHDIEFGSIDQVVTETLPALRRLQAAGKTRCIGFSGLPLKIFPAVLDRAEVDFILSYCHYTLCDTALERMLPDLEIKGVGVVNASPLAMGLLSDHGPQPWHPASPAIKETCRQAADFCRARGVSLAKLAIQFASSCPDISSTLTGAATVEEIRQCAGWIAEPVDRALLEEVRGVLEPIRDQTWPSGRAENN